MAPFAERNRMRPDFNDVLAASPNNRRNVLSPGYRYDQSQSACLSVYQ